MASSLVAAYFLPLILFYIWSLRNSSLEADELRLMDVVLLASVDGRFHALNRTTGRMLWSMDEPRANPQVAVTDLKELVSTQHGGLRTTDDFSLDDFSDEPTITETYIIEPQSGVIFVSPADSKPDDPLQKLPFTMQQLVDMSPFRIDHRTFVGKKRTSRITLDLGSGELVEVLDPEQPTQKRSFQSKDEDLLDELYHGALVHIDRTEYHVSVYSHGQVIHTLTYLSYGPNNVDKELQDRWRRTPDNLYHQPTPDGSLLMFKIDEKEPIRSFIKLKCPIVAVFDAVSIADRTDPLILAQPTPALSDLYPSRLRELRKLSKQDKVVYVGRVGDSLYALSNDTFPVDHYTRRGLGFITSLHSSISALAYMQVDLRGFLVLLSLAFSFRTVSGRSNFISEINNALERPFEILSI